MNKWLRRHKQKVLVIGGSLLMIAFLMQGAGQRIAKSQMNRTVARADSQNISALDLTTAERELAALRDFHPLLATRNLGIEDGAHWYLLKTEAKQQGFVGGPLDGESWIPDLAPEFAYAELVRTYSQQFGEFANQIAAMTANNPDEFGPLVQEAEAALNARRTQAADRAGLTQDEVDQAIATARGISRMIAAYARAARFSGRRAAITAAEREDAAVIDYVLIPAERITSESAEPAEDQLKELFEKYKDVTPADGEFGIGFRQPDRVKLTWLTIDKPAIQAALTVDGVELRKRHRQNPTLYPGEFETQRARIEQQMREEIASKVLSEADRIIRAEVLKLTRHLPANKGYKSLPADWATTGPRYEAIAQAVVNGVKSGLGITIDIPVVTIRDAEWTPLTETAGLPGIGASTVRLGGRQFQFSYLISAVRDLAGDNELLVQTGVPYIDSIPTDAQGRRYYVTILDARKESPADSLDAVREQVVEAFKTLRAFDKLKAESGQYTAIAVESLEAVVSLFHVPPPPEGSTEAKVDDLVIRKNIRVLKDNVGAPDPGLNVPEFRDAVQARAAEINPVTPADTIDPVTATLAIPVPKSTSLAVVRLLGRRPLTTERFRQFSDRAMDQLAEAELVDVSQPTPETFPFGRASMVRRHNFQFIGAKPEEDPAPSPGSNPAAETPTPPPTPIDTPVAPEQK